MNKKGFMFIETIVMCVILMVGLLVIYNSYTAAIAREKERLNYNTVAGEIRISLVKKYLIDKYPEWICVSETECSAIDALLLEDYLDITNVYISDIKSIYNIEQMYLARCTANFEDVTSVSLDFEVFLNSMKPCSNDEKYRFIAEFVENEDAGKFSYAWVEYPYVDKED